MNALDRTTFATAKLSFVLGVGLDAELPKLALRIANIFVGQYMCADNGGEAWPAIKRLCHDLGVSSERAVRQALYSLLERGHLVAERKAGGTTRYRIADRYFDDFAQVTQAHHEPTPQARLEPGLRETQAHHEPGTQAHHEPGTQAHHEPTNSGNRTPVNELREIPPQPPRGREGEDLPSGKTQASTSVETRDAFGRFEAVWSWGVGESLKAARAAFHRLSESDRESAIQGAPAFQSGMAGRQHPPHASTYLAERKWAFQARNASAASQTYARPMATFKNGVALLLADSYFGRDAGSPGAAENIIDLEAVRLKPTKPSGALSVPLLERDRRVVLHPSSEQLAAWHAYERRLYGRARLGLTRPAEWPPGEEFVEHAADRSARAAAIGGRAP
jgi:hypothetical protein